MKPEMTVITAGDTLQVSFDSLPLTSTARITVWEEDDEQQVTSHLFSPLLGSHQFSLLVLSFHLICGFSLPIMSHLNLLFSWLFFFFSLKAWAHRWYKACTKLAVKTSTSTVVEVYERFIFQALTDLKNLYFPSSLVVLTVFKTTKINATYITHAAHTEPH